MPEAERIRREQMERLATLAAAAEGATRALASAVEDARDRRLSWNMIGSAVGLTREGARKRWG